MPFEPAEDPIEALFDDDFSKLSLLLLWDGMTEVDGKTEIVITIDAPAELASILPKHPIVVDALQHFATRLREKFPERKFKIDIAFDTLVDERLPKRDQSKSSWRSFEVAMRLAERPDVYQELLQHRKP